MNKPSTISRLLSWLKSHKFDVILLIILVAVSTAVSATNMSGYPQRFEDEGTYVSQAWAVKEQHSLAHYTYWYDHPPLGWIQIAGYFTATDALGRYGSAISAGREFMLVIHIATIGLMYALARRMKIGRIASFIGILVYALSPLTVEFSRYVMLDNVALPWLLAAFLLALNPKRRLSAAVFSAVCMAIAILSKETFAVLLPVLLYTLWRNGDTRNRRYTLAAFGVIFITVSAVYLLYAALKNELFPGPGHVSLIGSLAWQLGGRAGSGSIFDAHSGTRGLIGYWLQIDYWLPAAGALAVIPAIIRKSTRPIGLALLVSFGLLLRSGYLPYPYIIVILPFAALCFAGLVDLIIVRQIAHKGFVQGDIVRQVIGSFLAAVLLIATISFIVPTWQPKLQMLTHSDQDQSSRQAVDWVTKHVSKDSQMIVESALWTDLETKGYNQPKPVWLYKTETDPEVKKNIGGWQNIDYVILNGPTVNAPSFNSAFPTASTAVKHGKLVAEFGRDNQKVLIYEVTP